MRFPRSTTRTPVVRSEPARSIVAAILIGVLCSFALSPVLASGFISDDALNSLISGTALEENRSRASHIVDATKYWLFVNGRFSPCGFLLDGFSFVSDLGWYKRLSLLAVLFSVGSFGYLVYLLAESASVALFTV